MTVRAGLPPAAMRTLNRERYAACKLYLHITFLEVAITELCGLASRQRRYERRRVPACIDSEMGGGKHHVLITAAQRFAQRLVS